MKLNQIKILREAHREDITGEEAIALLRKHCKDALETIDTPIVRGMRMGDRFQLIAGEDGGRKSKNTSNYYTAILDEVLPGEFPRRSKSIICTSFEGFDYAKSYGTVYALFPFDGVDIGVCPSGDIWDVAITLGGMTHELPEWNSIFKEAGVPDTSYRDMIRKMREIRDSDVDSDFKTFLIDLEAENDGMDFEDMIASEYAMPFTHTTTANPDYNDGEHELWISGKCVAIRWNIFLDIKEELANETE